MNKTMPAKCPKCQADRKSSTVSYRGETVTGLGFTPHFVDGTQHTHDPNRYTHQFTCTQGHAWSVSFRKPCLACPYPRTAGGMATTGDSDSVAEMQTEPPPEKRVFTGVDLANEPDRAVTSQVDADGEIMVLAVKSSEPIPESDPEPIPESDETKTPLPPPPRVPTFEKKKGSGKKILEQA